MIIHTLSNMIEYSNTAINVITVFLVILLGLIIANIFNNILRRFLRGFGLNKIIEEQLKKKIKLEEYFTSFIKYVIYLITLIIALDQLGLPTRFLKFIFIVIGLIIIIFTVLAFKDWVPNMIAGFYIYKNNKVKVGDTIKVRDIKGVIKSINLVETKIETSNKEVIFIPNSNLIRYEVVKEVGKNG